MTTARPEAEQSAAEPAAPPASGDEDAVVMALRRGDEAVFVALVDRHHAAMLRVAMLHVRNRSVAEEVVQEAWLGVLQGIDAFEQRSSLKTWIFRILANIAQTRGAREGRSVPFSALAADEAEGHEPAVDPDRFLDRGHPRWPGRWSVPPSSWAELPDERLLSHETLDLVRDTIERLPLSQREVIRLRDVEGWTSVEVCEALALSEGNQRVLLHRARSKVRAALERYLEAR